VSLLIDTHVFLWFQSESTKLGDGLRKTIAQEPDVYVSAAAFWEIAIKRQTGKLAFEGSPRAAALAAGFLELPIDGADAETAGGLDWDNRDPFDRVLVAHCLNRDLTLITADARLRSRHDIALIWAG
jgi:PIN domain nuclease of toxin-antitoxin system